MSATPPTKRASLHLLTKKAKTPAKVFCVKESRVVLADENDNSHRVFDTDKHVSALIAKTEAKHLTALDYLFGNQQTIEILRKDLENDYSEENLDFVSAIIEYQSIKDITKIKTSQRISTSSKSKPTSRPTSRPVSRPVSTSLSSCSVSTSSLNSEDYKDDDDMQKKLAKEIFETFVKQHSKSEVNLSAKIVSNIQERVEHAPDDLFDEARTATMNLMKLNSFPKFADHITTNVKESWLRIYTKKDPVKLGEHFYSNLFLAAPEFKQMFVRSPLHLQYKMFLSMIDSSVSVLQDLDTFVKVLVGMGDRHADYGCNTGMFGLTGKCLLQTLKKYDKDNWTEEIEEAWVVTFTVIAAIMNQCLPPGKEVVGRPQNDKCTLL